MTARRNETNDSSSMDLKIHLRELYDDENLFVRLHPSTVSQLCEAASNHPNQELSNIHSWVIQDEHLDIVQFLPLRIKANNDTSDDNCTEKWIYCSYNGGSVFAGQYNLDVDGEYYNTLSSQFT